jgi:hypothetical protein
MFFGWIPPSRPLSMGFPPQPPACQPKAAHSCDVVDGRFYVFGGWNGKRALNDRRRTTEMEHGEGGGVIHKRLCDFYFDIFVFLMDFRYFVFDIYFNVYLFWVIFYVFVICVFDVCYLTFCVLRFSILHYSVFCI